jgi:hypothetical protein
MPLYRGFKKGPPPPEEGPTRRVVRPGAKSSTPDSASTADDALDPAIESGETTAKPLSSPVETTRRVTRPDPGVRSRPESPLRPRPESAPATNPAASPTVASPAANPAVPKSSPIARDPLSSPVVGWLAIIAGPGRGEVLPLGYGVNDIGRGSGVRIQLDFGDERIALGNQAVLIYTAIIYTARSRRFYVQSVAAEIWLNGRPLRESTELTGGETLQLGQTRLRFIPLCGADFDWRDGG